jgi:hypothetical protein
MPSFFCHRQGYLILWAPNRGTGLMRKTQGSWLFGLGHLQILERFFLQSAQRNRKLHEKARVGIDLDKNHP